MDEYTLYLDESKNKKQTLFTISGIIVKNTNLSILESGIHEVKKCIWGEEYIKINHPILHCVELTAIKNNRKNEKFISSFFNNNPQYETLKILDSDTIKSIYENVYSKLCKTFKEIEGNVIGCMIDINKFKYIYGDDFKIDSELFFEVAMQEIIENYAYFLYINNGVGNIVYESRNNNIYTQKTPDYKLYNNFCKIKACNKGISFIDQDLISKTIRYLNINDKHANIAGLQLADFIAYNILQSESRSENQYSEFMKKIYDNLFNGFFDKADKNFTYYFGLKRLPYDFEKIHELEYVNEKIKKSNENLKKEVNRLGSKNSLLSDKKERLLKENEELKREILYLKAELEMTSAEKVIDKSI